MKAAVLLAPDWPGDEVVFLFEAAELPNPLVGYLRQHPARCADVGDGEVFIVGRAGFRAVLAAVRADIEAQPSDRAGAPRGLKALAAHLEILGRRLATDRDDDRSGDPLPGTVLHALLAEDIAEAGR